MKPSSSIIDYARNAAREHSIPFPDKVVAIYYRRSTVMAVGYNQPYKTHRKAWTPFKQIHAEFAGLMDLRRSLPWGETDVSNYSLYVHRVRRDGKDGLSKPCFFCEQMLDWAGITDIYWSETV
jgi:tRNA(Arg) A34 adenosine deaminase TadA